MKLKLHSLIVLGLLIFAQQIAFAQQNHNILQQIGIKDSLYSKVLDESRTIYVQVPQGYSSDKNQKYPVAYILDGEVFLPTVTDVQNYYSGGFTLEMILVGIANYDNRVRDLTPTTITTKYGMPFNEKSGEAAKFRKFIETELIPHIEANFSVTDYRTLIGHSYGGLFTIATLLEQPDLFANYLAIDPSLDWDDQIILKKAKKTLASENYRNKALFMSLSGQLHMQNSHITLENVMQDTTDYTLFSRSNISLSNLVKQNAGNGITYDWKFYPKDIHGTVAMPSIMDGLVSLFEWYQMENTDKINSFDTSKEELFEIIKHREQKLQKHFGYEVPPYPEELLNMSGYMNMDMQQLEKAKMYFEFAVHYFPKSPNAYDSLAEYYESQGDFGKALELVIKASELNDGAYYQKRVEDIKMKLD